MPPPHAYLNLFYISYKHSPNLEDAKKLHNPDAFIPVSSAREPCSALRPSALMSGSRALWVHIWNRYLPLIFKQKSRVFNFGQILFPPICITVSITLLHSQYKQEPSASPHRYAKVLFPDPYYFLAIPAKRMLPWYQWATHYTYHICLDSTMDGDRRDLLTLSSPGHLALLSHCQPSPGPCLGLVSTTHSQPAVPLWSPCWETCTRKLSISKRQLCSAMQQYAAGKQLTWARSGHPNQNWCLSFSGYAPRVLFAAWLNKPWTHLLQRVWECKPPRCLSFRLPFFPSWLSKRKQTTSVLSPAGIMARNTRQRNALADKICVSTLCPTEP